MAPSEKPIGGHEPCCVRRNFAPAHGDPAAASIDKFKRPKGSRAELWGHFSRGGNRQHFREDHLFRSMSQKKRVTAPISPSLKVSRLDARCRVLLRTTKSVSGKLIGAAQL